MGQLKYDIDYYEISVELANADEGTRSNLYAMITLFSDGKNVAELSFFRDDSYTAKKYLSGHQLNVNLRSDKYADTVDLLRNEKPIRLVVWYEGELEHARKIEARLATSELEPVGEGE